MNKPLFIHLSPMPEVEVEGEGLCWQCGRNSQWFGFPVMPANYPIPQVWDQETEAERPMEFICQIDCREIPTEVADLPHDGMLYFFAEIDYYAGYEGETMPMYAGHDYVRVVYIPEDQLDEENLALREDAYDGVFDPQRITLSFEEPTGDEPMHQLLGKPDHREWEDWDSPYQGWRLLFQMDSCDGPDYSFNFMDWGVFNILISHKALRQRDFSDCVGIILST